MLRVLQVHNFYQQPGGEDEVYRAEAELLRSRGHTVLQYTTHNDAIQTLSPASVAVNTIWNKRSYDELDALIRSESPDVIHFHNTFPLISPSAYYSAAKHNIPVVQTLHNYRLICPNATLFRGGAVCEQCINHSVPFPSIRHGCYRNSRAASSVVAGLLALHRGMGTWTTKTQVYVALTEFARDKFVQGGIPASKIAVKSNFLAHDPGRGASDARYALFVGRLVPEKGISTLIQAWQRIGREIPLKVVGDGPLRYAFHTHLPGIECIGYRTKSEVLSLMRGATCLVFPSEWYEGLPTTIMEAFGCGKPVVTSRLGSMKEILSEGIEGLHFHPGDPEDLARAVSLIWQNHDLRTSLSAGARRAYETRYTADANYPKLIEIYSRAIADVTQRTRYTGSGNKLTLKADAL